MALFCPIGQFARVSSCLYLLRGGGGNYLKVISNFCLKYKNFKKLITLTVIVVNVAGTPACVQLYRY